ncbi:MAG TPA: toll/interleukin-1 receptor domain-containing protein [Chthoniobacterales bacterium]|nr:toll/interleukin-1 receptor domain-containing protein [Chthoniobacterales bacterium]
MSENPTQDQLTPGPEQALITAIGGHAEPGPLDDSFWQELLTFIEDGKVIPVIGERAVTIAPNNELLYDWLAQRLAEEFNLPLLTELPPTPSLNQVVTAWLLRGGSSKKIYVTLFQILQGKELPEPGSALRDLAGIRDFDLFLTTTFDRLLEQALNEARFAGRGMVRVRAFSPSAKNKDLPDTLEDWAGNKSAKTPTVYHLLGQVSTIPNYVVWEEDALEFVCALSQQMRELHNLASELKERALLILGLNFSDWLVRFFLRVAKQRRLSQRDQERTEYLAEGKPELLPESMILFFGTLTKSIQIVQCDPVKFSAELARRWHERHPGVERDRMPAPPPPSMPRGAIFISYAREDVDTVWKLKQALEEGGCVVWFDLERLKPGDYWPAELEDEISKRCSLFVSVISGTTETECEAYYHMERGWAATRAGKFSPGEPFYLPVVIDDLSFEFQREPRLSQSVNATRAPGGGLPPEFIAHVRTIQQRRAIQPTR